MGRTGLLTLLIVCQQALGSVVEVDARDPYFERASNEKVGAKGDDVIDVTRDPCAGEPLAFDHAELEVLDSRFGDAQFAALPAAGCFDCEPLVVRWYHEPTGRLHYQVHVFRRRAEPQCPPGNPP